MQRINFTLDEKTIGLLEKMANEWYKGNRSAVIRDAVHYYSQNALQSGWVIVGFSPVTLDNNFTCHGCGEEHTKGEVLYRPTFQKGQGKFAFKYLPNEPWLDCAACLENDKS